MAEEIMGWKPERHKIGFVFYRDHQPWTPTTDMNQAMMCVENFCVENFEDNIFFGRNPYDGGKYTAYTKKGSNHNSDNLALAICQAICEARVGEG